MFEHVKLHAVITSSHNIHYTDVEDWWRLQAIQNSIVHNAIFVKFYKFLHYNVMIYEVP